jgi:hypothetical protein
MHSDLLKRVLGVYVSSGCGAMLCLTASSCAAAANHSVACMSLRTSSKVYISRQLHSLALEELGPGSSTHSLLFVPVGRRYPMIW